MANHNPNHGNGSELPPTNFDSLVGQMPEVTIAAQNIVSAVDATETTTASVQLRLPKPTVPIDTRSVVHRNFTDPDLPNTPPQ